VGGACGGVCHDETDTGMVGEGSTAPISLFNLTHATLLSQGH
jgi:hypothetical protein